VAISIARSNASTAPPIGRPSCNSNLMLYKTDKDSLVPQLANTEVRLPKLTNRHVTVKVRLHQCLTDYQWFFWGKIDNLDRSQRKALRQDTAPGHHRRKKKGAAPAISLARQSRRRSSTMCSSFTIPREGS
jgi:hypothetical protein